MCTTIISLGVAAFHLAVTSETTEWTVIDLVVALVADLIVTVALTEDQTGTDILGDTEGCNFLMTVVQLLFKTEISNLDLMQLRSD